MWRMSVPRPHPGGRADPSTRWRGDRWKRAFDFLLYSSGCVRWVDWHSGQHSISMGSSTLKRGDSLVTKTGVQTYSSWPASTQSQEERVMNPTTVFCPTLACPTRGQTGQGNIG